MNENVSVTPKWQQNMFLQAVIADHVVDVIMQLMKRAWPWARKRWEDMPNVDARIFESKLGVLFSFSQLLLINCDK